MNSQQHKRITLKDISEQCGYSVNTVSRALRDDPQALGKPLYPGLSRLQMSLDT